MYLSSWCDAAERREQRKQRVDHVGEIDGMGGGLHALQGI